MVSTLKLPTGPRRVALSGTGFVALALSLTWLPLPVAALMVLGVAAGLLALIFPWTVWLALAVTLPIAAGLRVGLASPADALIAAAVMLWWGDRVRRRAVIIQRTVPIAPVFVYILVLLAASLSASDLGEALPEVVKWIEFALVVLVAPLALPNRKVEWLVIALLTAAVIQAALGLYQFVFRVGPDWFLIQGRFMRASGVFRQPNPYAGYLGLTLPVALSLSLAAFSRLRDPARGGAEWTRLAVYPVMTAVIGAGLIASWSRGGWLGALAGGVTVLALYSRRTAAALGIGILAVGLLALVGALTPAWLPAAATARLADLPAYVGLGGVLEQPVTDDNFAVIERVAHWVAALRMWELQPWLGVGPGNYAAAYAAVAIPRWDDPLGHAHNIYLNVLAESGLVGFVAFGAMWLAMGGWLLHQVRTARDRFTHALSVGVVGVLAHLAVHSFFDNLFVQGMVTHLALWLGAVAVAGKSSFRYSVSSFHESEP